MIKGIFIDYLVDLAKVLYHKKSKITRDYEKFLWVLPPKIKSAPTEADARKTQTPIATTQT